MFNTFRGISSINFSNLTDTNNQDKVTLCITKDQKFDIQLEVHCKVYELPKLANIPLENLKKYGRSNQNVYIRFTYADVDQYVEKMVSL